MLELKKGLNYILGAEGCTSEGDSENIRKIIWVLIAGLFISFAAGVYVATHFIYADVPDKMAPSVSKLYVKQACTTYLLEKYVDDNKVAWDVKITPAIIAIDGFAISYSDVWCAVGVKEQHYNRDGALVKKVNKPHWFNLSKVSDIKLNNKSEADFKKAFKEHQGD